jgi:hypothetical protein
VPETKPFNPLTPAQQQLVEQGCAQCDDFARYLDQLDKIGVPTDAHRETHAGFDQLFKGIRQQFMSDPNQNL